MSDEDDILVEDVEQAHTEADFFQQHDYIVLFNSGKANQDFLDLVQRVKEGHDLDG